MTTDTSEKGLEALIVAAMTGQGPAVPVSGAGVKETAASHSIPGLIFGDPHDYDRAHAVELAQLRAFLFYTQPKVAADPAYRNAIANSDRQNARVEMDSALWKVMIALMKDDTELFKQFSDNESFRRGLTEAIFALTYTSPSV